MKLLNLLGCIAGLVLVVGFITWQATRDEQQIEDQAEGDGSARTASAGETSKGSLKKKDWSYQTPEAKPAPKVGGATAADENILGSKSPLPKQPHIKGAVNPQVASVIEAGKTGKHPERRTALALPQPFDPVAWEKNPQAYLDVCEPGRVFQSAKPGKDVKQLGAKGSANIEIASGESTELAVKAIPGAPVTFTSFDLGNFSNKLTSITVKADDKGIARATFIAVGTVNDCNILAASPMCSGQVNFMVFVPPPEPTQAPDDQAGTSAKSSPDTSSAN